MYNKEEVLQKVDILYNMWKKGSLGGEVMPEDANPHLGKSEVENYLYFTLPMALNYQRNSYKLWESALNTYNDKETNFVFNPKICIEKTFEEVQYALVKYKIALQKQKQTEIWLSLCKTFVELYDGEEPKEYSWSKSHFYFVDKPCEKRNLGYPLDSMSIMPECNKYFVDLTEEDRNRNKENYKEDDVIDFIVKNCSK